MQQLHDCTATDAKVVDGLQVGLKAASGQAQRMAQSYYVRARAADPHYPGAELKQDGSFDYRTENMS
jgi:hypothetical protein